MSTRSANLSYKRLLVLGIVLLPYMGVLAQCPSYTHKDDVITGNRADLPDGIYAYGRKTQNGLFLGNTRTGSPSIVPNTESHRVTHVDFSDDGSWICYRNQNDSKVYLIKPDGGNRTAVPLGGASPHAAGFYKSGPQGTEIWFSVPTTQIRAVRVTLGTGAPTSGSTRTICNLNGQMHIKYGWIDVAGDAILARATPIGAASNHTGRTTHFTIPNGGNGTAGPSNAYIWLNDDTYREVYGCGHALSNDGALAVANSAYIGNGACVPNKNSSPPMDHKGFYMTPFRHTNDTKVTIHDHIDKYGTSINWVPTRYRFGTWEEVDFSDWQFSNNSDYMAGRSIGDRVQEQGVWCIHWKTNTWTLMTPSTQRIDAICPALHLGSSAPQSLRAPYFEPSTTTFTSSLSVQIKSYDAGVTIRYTTDGSDPTTSSAVFGSPLSVTQTTNVRARAFLAGVVPSEVSSALYTKTVDPDTTPVDPNDPQYQIVSPNGGEAFRVGQTIDVVYTSVNDGSAILRCSFGRYTFRLPGFDDPVNPNGGRTFSFTIPEYFYNESPNAQGGMDTIVISPVSDDWHIIVEDYNPSTGYTDRSDAAFRVTYGVSAVTAGNNDGNVPENAIDSDLSTRWSSEGTNEWISFDLGAVKWVSSVWIAWYNGGLRVANFGLSISGDGANWISVYDGQSSGTSNDLEQYSFSLTQARYVRVNCHGNNQNNWNSITEVLISRQGGVVETTTGVPRIRAIPTSGSHRVVWFSVDGRRIHTKRFRQPNGIVLQATAMGFWKTVARDMLR